VLTVAPDRARKRQKWAPGMSAAVGDPDAPVASNECSMTVNPRSRAISTRAPEATGVNCHRKVGRVVFTRAAASGASGRGAATSHVALSRAYPGLQVNSQRSAMQVGVAFGGAGHGVHRVPHVPSRALSTHIEPHA
jgi:hypothetical protein